MSEAEAKQEAIEKLKKSRSNCAGWLTRTISQYETLKSCPSPAITSLQAIISRVSGQLSNLQSSHDKYVSALEDEALLQEAEDWFEKYFNGATECMNAITAKLQELRNKPNVSTAESAATQDGDPDSPDSMNNSSSTENPTPSTSEGQSNSSSQSTSSLEGQSQAPGQQQDSSNPQASQIPLLSPSLPVVPSIDGWIDQLVEGQETVIQSTISSSPYNLSDAMLRLEMERDLPKIELPHFDGSALMWPRFVEQFHAQVHSRPSITDTRRMDILQSHVTGEAKKLILGLGYSGRNYAQSLKELKFAFGHKASVARAYINSVTSGGTISQGDSTALRTFYISVRDCLTTLQQLNYVGELYSTDVLQRALRRIPIDKRVQ